MSHFRIDRYGQRYDRDSGLTPPPPNICKDRVTIRVYPFMEEKPIPGWITSGMLDAVAGGPSRRIMVEVVQDDSCERSDDDYRIALKCLQLQGYTNAWLVHADGTRDHLRAL